MKRLRVPVAVAFVLTACGGDDGGECSMTREPCVQDPNDTANICPQNVCVDGDDRRCPTGCIPAGTKRYCVSDGNDAGIMCPQPPICIVDGQQCPAGCTPVG